MGHRRRPRVSLAVALCALLPSATAVADEGGASVWLPGQFASFAAMPGDPGWRAAPMHRSGVC